MGRYPSPPQSVSRGMTEVITWTVTTGDNHPDKLVYRLFDPNDVLIEMHEYPGATGLSMTHHQRYPLRRWKDHTGRGCTITPWERV